MNLWRQNMRPIEKRLKVTELVLRCAICGAGALVAVLVGTDTEIKEIFTIEKRAKFTDMRSLLFLVIANGMAASYCLVQGLRCAVSLFGESGSMLLNKPLAWIIFSCDQANRLSKSHDLLFNMPCSSTVLELSWHIWMCWRGEFMHERGKGPSLLFQMEEVMAYVMLSAAAAATQSAALAEMGQREFEWMKLCNLYRKFCTQVGEGIIGSYVVSLSTIVLSCVSAFNLFRLYGNKGKSIGVW